MAEPIFIHGVPRSGTTLLRAMLDSHPSIAIGPETPWLGAHQPRSVVALHRFLCEDPAGYCAAFGMDREVARRAARSYVESLLGAYARARGKPRWGEKTPDNALHLPALAELFPDARHVVIRRDALDCALSASRIDAHRRGLSPRFEETLCLGEGRHVRATLFAGVLRWTLWSRLIDEALEGRSVLRVRYESLAREPEAEIRRVLAFLGEPFDPRVLAFADHPHDFLPREWGGADLRLRPTVVRDRLERAARELGERDRRVLGSLARHAPAWDEPPNEDAPARDDAETLAGWIAEVCPRLGLDESLARDAAERWVGGLWRTDWPRSGLRVRAGLDRHPLAWLVAILGARVGVETAEPGPEDLVKLARQIRVRMSWSAGGEGGPAAAALE